MLTLEERATNAETLVHIARVRTLLNTCVTHLLTRGERHDQSKLEPPEVSVFAEFTAKLKNSTYGSDEYKGFLNQMKPALDHHYANNDHHPEHWPGGVTDMSLISMMEMLCDWKAATERHHDGCLMRSIEINAKRFNIPEGIVCLLKNTAIELGWDRVRGDASAE